MFCTFPCVSHIPEIGQQDLLLWQIYDTEIDHIHIFFLIFIFLHRSILLLKALLPPVGNLLFIASFLQSPRIGIWSQNKTGIHTHCTNSIVNDFGPIKLYFSQKFSNTSKQYFTLYCYRIFIPYLEEHCFSINCSIIVENGSMSFIFFKEEINKDNFKNVQSVF